MREPSCKILSGIVLWLIAKFSRFTCEHQVSLTSSFSFKILVKAS